MKRLAMPVALALLVGVACGGGSSPGLLPRVHEARSERVVVDGVARPASTVTVTFDRAVTLAASRIPFASYFEFSVPDGYNPDGAPRRVLVQRATLDDARTVVTLDVNALIPDSTTLFVARRAFRDGSPGNIEATVTGDLTPQLVVLATTALAISRDEIFTPPQVQPAPADLDDPAAMRALLQQHLEARGASEDVARRALARFDAALPPGVEVAPKAMAALAALTGTFAEPAIDSLLTGANCSGRAVAQVVFQPPPEAPELFARATRAPDGRRVISLNPSLAGERLEQLMAVVAHEAIHCDGDAGIAEEIAATAFDTFLYLELVAADPDIVFSGTPLTRDLNVDAVAMINSGRRLPESVGILPSAGTDLVLPGTSARYGSFAELVAAAYPSSAGATSPREPLADAYASALAARAGMPADSAFDLVYLDEVLARAIDVRVLAAAIFAFGLVPPGGG